jgi:hypothetical protein
MLIAPILNKRGHTYRAVLLLQGVVLLRVKLCDFVLFCQFLGFSGALFLHQHRHGLLRYIQISVFI